ncbi:lipid transfer-like protein VAS [Hordeum vulgare]|nr:lipid transfer-like protein VAS [Hordeum vulgare]
MGASIRVVAMMLLVAGAAAQSSSTSECVSKLVRCADSMNGTEAQMPPKTCCSLLREAVKNGRVGLCALYASFKIFKAFNSNDIDALRLSKRCGVTEDISSFPGNSLVPLTVLLSRIFYRIDHQNLDVKSWTRWLAMKNVEASLVLELAGISAWDNKRARIMQLHFQLSVRNDYKLAQVLESVLISDGGVQPEIDTELLYNMVKAKGSA